MATPFPLLLGTDALIVNCRFEHWFPVDLYCNIKKKELEV